jgi:phenylpropionate dioxygenase-like ring-hydroxylating dioxygenase large terminal subunit
MIPFPDVAVVTVLMAISLGLFSSTHASPLMLVFPAAIFSFAVFLLASTFNSARWLSKRHLQAHSSPLSQKLTSLRHLKSTGRNLPCPYPDAWYGLCYSDDLKERDLIDAVCCGVELIVCRYNGKASVLDAYCTHQGAHLGHGGGKVDASGCLVCPFHGWRFDCKGKAVSTPCGDAIPNGSDLKEYPCVERNGVVCVWMAASSHHKSASAISKPPWFEVPLVDEVDSKAWRYDGFAENIVNAVTQELQENGPDIAHLHHLHHNFAIDSLQWLLSHSWEMTWTPGEGDESHLAFMKVFQWFILLGRWKLPMVIEANLTQVSSALVIFRFKLPLIGRLVMIQTVTPQAPACQRMCHGVFSEPRVPRFVAKILLYIVQHAVEQDVPIWQHKRFEPNPRLTHIDAKVKVYRNWCRQFTKDGISFSDAQMIHVRKELGLPDEGSLQW